MSEGMGFAIMVLVIVALWFLFKGDPDLADKLYIIFHTWADAQLASR